MPIRFIVNDPQSPFADERIIDPHQDRTPDLATFQLFFEEPEAVYDFGDAGFLYWQCREAALRGLDAWEAIAGPLDHWALNQQQLALIQVVPNRNTANAFYNRQSLQFFRFQTDARAYFSGASTDVVTHELGHACLDVIRPELWDSVFMESGALHEAFGDIIAILTALSDQGTRIRLLQDPQDLQAENFVEATAEDLSDGIRQGIQEGLLPNRIRNASAPRHASNNFQWTLPFNLPGVGDPGVLINEIHSFGQLFSGCIYDVIVNIFHSAPQQDEASLLAAAQTTGELLVTACSQAPLMSRLFKSVGRTMVLTDNDLNEGQNFAAIDQAFANHGIDLEFDDMLEPIEALAGRAPALDAAVGSSIITRSSRRGIIDLVGESAGQRLFVRPDKMGAVDVAVVQNRYYLPLDDVAEGLAGVEAPVVEDILVGEQAGRAAILGAAPIKHETNREVQHFVRSLVDNEAIDMGGDEREKAEFTHRVVKAGDRKVLRRVGFSC